MRRFLWGSLTAVAVSGAAAFGAVPWRPAEVPTVERASVGFFAPPAGLTVAGIEAALAAPQEAPPEAFHEFHFTRGKYTDGRLPRDFPYLGDGGPTWSTDFPKGDRQFMQVVRRLSGVDASEWENPVALEDPGLRRYPFLYMLEMGKARLTDEEVLGLRSYLEAGGFLVVDDFWGSREWASFQSQMSRVLPGRPIVDVPPDHLLFHVLYDIDEDILQIPNLGYAYEIQRGNRNPPTHEQDGFEAHVRGIFDEKGRLMVAINWNTDLGDAWEHAENPYYPLKFSTFACALGLNMIIYGMTQ